MSFFYARHTLGFLFPLFLILALPVYAKSVRYDLVATEGQVNLSGKKTVDFALFINGSLPAPTLEFTEGDEAEILVRNQIPGQEVSIHWHGLLLPPEMDGVPYVNTPPIRTGESFTFKFSLRQAGTYWYHTHTNVQEQKGIYGAFIIHPKMKAIHYDKEAVVVLSDWSDEDATQILSNLRKDGDYYLYKKGTLRSWLGAMEAGALSTYFSNEWTRMGGMDFSDVGYDAFLINGKRDSQLMAALPGEIVRIRLVNAAASSYFHIALGDQAMQVISADGIDIAPISTREILIGMAETYDILFQVPLHKNYQLKASAQDGTGEASTWIGGGEKVFAPVKPLLDMYASMEHHGSHDQHESEKSLGKEMHAEKDHHAAHEHGAKLLAENKLEDIKTLTVDDIKAQNVTEFATSKPIHDIKLVLDGDMERYVWHINGKTIQEERTIEIHAGEVVRFTMINETMMHHPMHLHGHFFRVLNRFGAESPWKHTVDVPPHQTRIIEFLADEPGEWMLHCHNLYHMKTGMARVVKYSSFRPSKKIAEIQKNDPHLHDHSYFYGRIEAATNHAQADIRLSQTWNELDLRLETRKNYSWDLEGDLFYRRWTGKYLNFIVGGSSFEQEILGVAGVGYLLPMLIESTLVLNHEGKLRLDLEKHFQWSRYLFTNVDISFRQRHETEWEVSLMYANNWAWSAGFKVTEENLGFGLQYRF